MFYAASVHLSGLYAFETKAKRLDWMLEHDGFPVPAEQVDPEIRRQTEGAVTW